MSKEPYERAQLEVTELIPEDVITTSKPEYEDEII